MNRIMLVGVFVLALVLSLSACTQAPATPQIITTTPEVIQVEVTRIVEGTPEVVEVVVTATPAPEPTEAPTETPAPRGSTPIERARISLSSKLNNLDPGQPVIQPDIITQYLVAGRLFRLEDDWSAVPELAEGMEVSDDGLTVTVTLKEGLLYSDGSPITAEDVAFAYERQRDLEGPWLFLLNPIESAEVTDDRTVVFHLSQPYLGLSITLGHMAMNIHPKAQVEADPDYFNHPVSSGQYVLKEWTPGASTWTIEENPNYVGGPSMIREIEISAVPDLTSRVLQLTTGAIDYVYDLPVVARESFPPEVETYPVPIKGMYHVVFNLTLPEDHPLRNADVRHAISLAIDREEINEKAFFGISTPATGFLYPGVEEGVDVLPNGGKQDIEAARQRLASTPFADGFEVTLQTWGQRPGWTDAALVIKENLAEIGITVEVEPIEDAVAVANLRSGSYEMQFSGNTQDPLTFLRNQFVPGTFWADASRYNNPEVTQLLDDAQTATTEEERTELLQEAQRLAFEDLPLIPISERVVLTGNRVGRDILYEANYPPGINPAVRTVEEMAGMSN